MYRAKEQKNEPKMERVGMYVEGFSCVATRLYAYSYGVYDRLLRYFFKSSLRGSSTILGSNRGT